MRACVFLDDRPLIFRLGVVLSSLLSVDNIPFSFFFSLRIPFIIICVPLRYLCMPCLLSLHATFVVGYCILVSSAPLSLSRTR